MGRSGKPAIAYRFSDHLAYLAAAIERLEFTDITIVSHDWGVVLGLALCRLMPQRVRALAFMVGHIHPIARWEEMEPGARALFSQLRTEDAGRRMVLDENIFVETILPSGVRRRLTPAEMDAYREPYHEPSARLLLWQWARSIPIAGEPPEMVEVVAANQQFLATSAIDWDEVHVDVPDLDLALPHNAAGLDDAAHDIAAQASAACEAAVCWDDAYVVRRLADVRAV